MKRLFVLGLLMALLLFGCGQETPLPGGTTGAEIQPTQPTQPTQETTQPTTQTTESATQSAVPYLYRPPAEACIFQEPDGDSPFVQVFGHEGAFTIVEERYDEEGNLWGKLKSGIGWTNLTDPFCGGAQAPLVVAAYASPQVLSGDHHLAPIHAEDPFSVQVSVLAHKAVTAVTILENDLMNDQPGKALYTLDRLEPGKPLVAQLSFPGDFSSYVVTYVDDQGQTHQITLWMSMDDSNTIAWH